MTTQSPNPQPPLHLTITDITETRDWQPTTFRMRWPVDEDTTRRLRRLTVNSGGRVAWWRRVIRRLSGT
jgi:hypothetical protein